MWSLTCWGTVFSAVQQQELKAAINHVRFRGKIVPMKTLGEIPSLGPSLNPIKKELYFSIDSEPESASHAVPQYLTYSDAVVVVLSYPLSK